MAWHRFLPFAYNDLKAGKHEPCRREEREGVFMVKLNTFSGI